MSVAGVNHVNIRTTDIEKSIRFYQDVLGFTFKSGPEVMGNRGNWLCDDNGQPIIHLRKLEPDATSTGPIDHIALSCSGKADVIAKLQAHNIEFRMSENLIPNLTQIFLEDPHGIMLELNFNGD